MFLLLLVCAHLFEEFVIVWDCFTHRYTVYL